MSSLVERGIEARASGSAASDAPAKVLVAADASLEGTAGGPISAMVHYDLPTTGVALLNRMFRARQTNAEMFVFRDLSRCVSFEHALLAKLGLGCSRT